MKAEMTEHLGFEKHDPAGKKSGNTRNGNSKKTIKGEFGNSRNRSSPRPELDLRAGNHPQRGNPIYRLRRQDHLHVCSRDDHP